MSDDVHSQGRFIGGLGLGLGIFAIVVALFILIAAMMGG